MTTYGATNDDRVVKFMIFCFHCHCERHGPIYLMLFMSWLLMSCWHEEPGISSCGVDLVFLEYSNLSTRIDTRPTSLYSQIPWFYYPAMRFGLSHWGWDKMAPIFQTTFSNAFSWMKMYEFRFKVLLKFVPKFELTIFQHWFRQWLGTVQATNLSEPMIVIVYWCMYVSLGVNELYYDEPVCLSMCLCIFLSLGSYGLLFILGSHFAKRN